MALQNNVITQAYQACKVLPWFFCLWWAIAFWTDLGAALKLMGLLPDTWASTVNYDFLKQSLTFLNVPGWLVASLFTGIIAWLALCTLAFAVSCYYLVQQNDQWQHYLMRGFVISMALWLAFFIADQIIMNFELEQNHMVQGGFELLCMMAFCWLSSVRSTS